VARLGEFSTDWANFRPLGDCLFCTDSLKITEGTKNFWLHDDISNEDILNQHLPNKDISKIDISNKDISNEDIPKIYWLG
jgi:hypothetical protein